MKQKWFDGKKKRDNPALPPVEGQEGKEVDRERLLALVQMLHSERKRLHKSTVELLMRLIILPPSVRLKVNLGIVMNLMVKRPINNILTQGLLDEERLALIDLQLKRVETRELETAHSLLNIEERIYFVGKMRGVFNTARSRRGAHLFAEEAEEALEGKELYGRE